MLLDTLWPQKRILGEQITVKRAGGRIGSYNTSFIWQRKKVVEVLA